MRVLRWLGLLSAMFVSGGYVAVSDAASASSIPEKSRMWMTVGEHRFAITLADNAAAGAFARLLPLTIEMSDLNRNEKHASLPEAMPANASKPGTIHSGDLMLYGADTLVVFYSTFDSAYAYTRLGRVDDIADLVQALGRGDVRVMFSKD
ncbi:cyclophilin-like fold protein [Pseudomonas sp. NPDC098747]|uniref:cyclophilin-like fold protein n=1 Tax=Pseudomonas sp. NPDC098747 TaxID=3364487 RepID=UPI00383B37F7